MPNHLHLVGEFDDAHRVARGLGTELGAFSRRWYSGKRIWEPVAEAEILSTRLHLLRHIRYVHLNPCRAGLASDPLEWTWSTHRDVVGAAAPSWVDLPELADIMDCSPEALPREIHAYVSGDPTVRVDGTRLPGRIDDARQLVCTLASVGEAVIHAGRASSDALHRRGSAARRIAVHLASKIGSANQVAQTEWLGVSDEALRCLKLRALSRSEAEVLDAAMLILSARERFARNLPKPQVRAGVVGLPRG